MPTSFILTHEQRLRAAAQFMVPLIRPNMTNQDLQDAASQAVRATAALEAQLRRQQKP